MNRLLVLSIISCFSFTSNAQYCISGGPSSAIDSNVESVTLIGASGSINYLGCPGLLGVEQYTQQTVSLGRGNNYSMDVQFGTCGGNYNGAGEAWIDFNQNSVFEASESIGTWIGIPPSPMSTFNFTVPLNSILGNTKMRIIQQEGGTNPLDPCASFTWGSAVDFNVVLIEGIDCSGYLGDDLTTAIDVPTLPYTDNHSNAICYSNQNQTYNSPDVFYRVTVDPASPFLNVSLCGSNFDTYLSILEPNGTFIIGNDDATACSPQSEVSLNATGLSVVYVVVEGWAAEIGDYTLIINDDILSTQNNTLDNFRVFPNPAKTNVRLTNNVSGLVVLKDMNGSTIFNREVGPQANINIDGLATGVYFLQFQTGNQQAIKKLIIEQ